MIWILGKGEHELGLEKGGWRTRILASLGNLFFFLKMYFILSVFLPMSLCSYECRCQKSLDDAIRFPLELEFQAVVSLWVPNTEPLQALHTLSY